MADVDLSGLDELYAAKPEQAKESSSGPNLSGLEDIYKAPSKGSPLETAKDAITGAGDTLGISQQIGGLAEGVPDAAQSALHNMIPSLVGKSPSQVNAALKALGVKGDIGPTNSDQMYKQGTKDTLADQAAALKRSPIAYRAGEAGGLGLGAMATAGLAPELIATSKATPLIGKMAAGAVNAAPIGAAYGAANSSGSLVGGTPQEMQQVGKSAALGAGIGSALGAAAPIVGKGLAKLGDIPGFKELAERYKIGQQGKSLGSETDQLGTSAEPESLDTALSQHDARTANELLTGLNDADDRLGKAVGTSLDQATQKGVVIKATPQLSDQLDKIVHNIPSLEDTSTSALDRLKQKGELAVEKERQLGNDASYSIEPSEDSEGNTIHNLVVRKRGVSGSAPETAQGQLSPEEVEAGPVGLSGGEEQGSTLQKTGEPSVVDSVTVNNAYDNPGASDKITSLLTKFKNEGLNPSEMWELKNELAQTGKTLNSSSNANDRLIANEIFSATDNINSTLKNIVPEYGNAANRMSEFRRLMPETILSKDNPADVTGLRVSGTRNVDQKLMQNLKNMVRGIYTDNDQAKGSFTNLLKGMQELNANELKRKAVFEADPANAGKTFKTIFDDMGVQPQQIEDYIKQQAMRSKVLQSYGSGPDVDLGKVFTQPVALAKQGAGFAAEKLGQLNKNPLLGTSQKLFAAPDDALTSFSNNVLSKVPGQKPLADALNKAVAGKDQTAKNAVLFTIMQNPNLRTLVESNNLTF